MRALRRPVRRPAFRHWAFYTFIGAPPDHLEEAAREVEAPPSTGRWKSQDAALLPRLLEEGAEALQKYGYVSPSGETISS